ncbi:hypothetical protein [Acinetobacter baumannii]|uniref:hypothetical protein n=1 Tax=Acinetobacter baumannii TaxID=470 RepID=UPI000810E6F5|nr:hypothetical protein [Acinetobacter baumannii]MDC4638512.1 hypothetical protein [Acinetobacter baumannii]MDC5350418.1 hypothetical protein [Acinetobacter baumannii]MDC5668504.1 hypothetical protein [Acinetobacter baumannii]MDC5679191.1 hypothetical protein [Acinetobacter baumannii]MDH2570027.1 hypothetical protein [Acinetobacter baumannii]
MEHEFTPGTKVKLGNNKEAVVISFHSSDMVIDGIGISSGGMKFYECEFLEDGKSTRSVFPASFLTKL